MERIYAVCEWVVKPRHLYGRFIRVMNVATVLDCEVCIDWWKASPSPFARDLVVSAPSEKALKQSIERANTNLGLTNWNRESHEYWLRITQNGKIPTLQMMMERTPDYFGNILEGFLVEARLAEARYD